MLLLKKLSHIFVNGFFIMPATLYLTLLLFGTEKLVFIAPLLILSYTVIKYSCRLFIAMGIMTLIMFPVGTLNKNVPENEYVGTVVAISNYGFMLNNKNSVYVFSDVEVRLG